MSVEQIAGLMLYSGHQAILSRGGPFGGATYGSKEYRALGITTALSPQIDIATEPRWGRFSGTFGEDPLYQVCQVTG